MNLFDQSLLALDIGTFKVTGMAFRIVSGRIAKSSLQSFESFDTAYAIKSVVDQLETDIGVRFDSAFVTGNFGALESVFFTRARDWNREHRVADPDIAALIAEIPEMPDGFAAMHIVPLRYDLGAVQNITTPIGQLDAKLSAAFGAIAYADAGTAAVREHLRNARIMGSDFSDPSFLVARTMRPQKIPAVLLDLGASATTVSVWTARGPVFMKKIPVGQSTITAAIADQLNLKYSAAESAKRENMSTSGGDMDRFTPAGRNFDFSRSDVNDIAVPILTDILESAYAAAANAISKYAPVKLYLFGGGANICGIDATVSGIFDLPVKNLGANAAATAACGFLWKRIEPAAKTYVAKQTRGMNALMKILSAFRIFVPKKKKRRFVPIMPSTLAFNMRDPNTYARFAAAGISMIHVDIMDGFYVDKIYGGIDELKFIRAHTPSHLNVHLQVENPMSWVESTADAGANTIIISTGTVGVKKALAEIKRRGLRAGIALHPDSKIDILKPILRDIDEVLVMAIIPGASGRTFIPTAAARIAALDNTRKRYGLNFKISVDGGINPETAKICWKAGADFLASGSYLANAPDMPAAVVSLLKQ
ncbi:MAG: ribulose-phosphate 3-epimerase [Proteobacteria bacterium]|nr:ribulose-phosphate 3-epimerase [Pseudomonadota bacterium]